MGFIPFNPKAMTASTESSTPAVNPPQKAIKSFVRWLYSEGIILEGSFDKISTIRRPKTPDTLLDVPSQEEMTIFLDGGDFRGGDFPTAFPERDRLLLELMYGSGLRVSEAAQIRLDDLRPEQNAILINGKGGPYGKNAKHRLVPLNPSSYKALNATVIVVVIVV